MGTTIPGRHSVFHPNVAENHGGVHVFRQRLSELNQPMTDLTLKRMEKELLETVLNKTHWDLHKSARLLRISVVQIKRKIKVYQLKKPDLLSPDK